MSLFRSMLLSYSPAEVTMLSQAKRTRLPRILLAECDCELRALVKHALERAAYRVDGCSSASELRHILDSLSGPCNLEGFDLLLFNKQLLDQSTLDRIFGLQRHQAYPPLILFDGWVGKSGLRVDGLKVAAVLDSPTNITRLLAQIRRITPHR